MNTSNYKKGIPALYGMQALAKGFSVFYFVLLPVFYFQKLITPREVGYIGALFIVMLIIGAVVVVRWLHILKTKSLLQLASLVSIVSSIILFFAMHQHNLDWLVLSFGLMGLSVGVSMSGVNVVAAHFTNKGDRYQTLAKLGMLTDLIRIIFPIIIAGLVSIKASNYAAVIIVFTSVLFLYFASSLPDNLINDGEAESVLLKKAELRLNKPFRFALSLEFLDSFSSSQLFVFLPLLFIAKGYSLQNSLLLQSFIFLGYLCGRWVIGVVAKRISGVKAVSYSEIGMAIAILLLLLVQPIWLLYILTFVLGIFARGTSPAIKAIAFDSLSQEQIKKGSALHVVAGDSGSALGQLLFGLLIAWYGVKAPFIASILVALIIVAMCSLLVNSMQASKA